MFKQMMKALGPASEADSIGDGEELADDLHKIVPQPDEMPEEPYSHLVGRCQQLVEIRKLQIKLAEESIPEILDEFRVIIFAFIPILNISLDFEYSRVLSLCSAPSCHHF